MEIQNTDVAVVGAGPIGLELAVALKRAGIDYLHFDARQIGYTISWFAPGTRFFSSNDRIAIAGVPLQTPDQGKCSREQYLAYLRTIVQEFDLQVKTYEPVIGIERCNDGFALRTRAAAGERHYRARRVVLVTGGTDHPRRLGISGEDLPHVSHYFDDPHRYFRKRLLIVGGKNSAVEAALRCHHAGAFISLCYRRAALPAKSIKYWLLPEMNGLIAEKKIPAYFNAQPTAITAASVRIGPSVFAEAAGGASQPEPREIVADFVLALIGYEQDNTLFKIAGIELSGSCGAPIYDEQTMQTSIAGLYVAGTAVGGTQDKYNVFIENCHVHVERILASLTGVAPPAAPAPLAQPES